MQHEQQLHLKKLSPSVLYFNQRRMEVINIAFQNIYGSFWRWAHGCVHLLGVWWGETPTTNDCQYAYLPMGFHVVWRDCCFCHLAHRINTQRRNYWFPLSLIKIDSHLRTGVAGTISYCIMVFSKVVGRKARAAVRGSRTLVDGYVPITLQKQPNKWLSKKTGETSGIFWAMIKLIIISLFAIALVLFAVRFFPTVRFQIQRLLQNPFVRAILFRGLWRLIRLLIFRRWWG